MSVGACMTLPSYSDPLIDAADDSEIAIIANLCFFGFGCIDRIRDAYGKDIPGFSSEQDPFTTENKKFFEFRLPPGEYDIWYEYYSKLQELFLVSVV